MKYYIIAGESSGDLHGSNLMRGLKEADPEAQFRFWGGELMESVGGTLVKDYRETAIMGFVEVLGSLKKIAANLALCKKDLLQYQPDLVILIDYPGFNFRIAKFAKEHNFKVFYYISPKVWAWKESRVKYLKRDVDRLFIIFPFEIEYFKKQGIEALYNGNPLLDSIAQHPSKNETVEEFRERLSLPDRAIIALLPGSRKMEINYLLPRYLELEKRFPNHLFLLAATHSIPDELYQKWLKGSGIKLLYNETYSIMRHSEVTVLASGTASLEAALLGVPQVVCYGGNEISFQIAKRVVKLDYVSLPNLILNRGLVKELLQRDCNVENIEREIHSLQKRERRERMLKGYQTIRENLGGEGASLKVAKAMINELEEMRDRERFYLTIESPLGQLKLTSNHQYLLSVEQAKEPFEADSATPPQVLLQAKRELDDYFNNKRVKFEVPIRAGGTQFQKRVWEELIAIPFGSVKKYGEIAKIIGSKDASRAVGMACKMNPLLIIIPCHRVVGANNKLTGFNIGLDKKSYLLNHEKAYQGGEMSLFAKKSK